MVYGLEHERLPVAGCAEKPDASVRMLVSEKSLIAAEPQSLFVLTDAVERMALLFFGYGHGQKIRAVVASSRQSRVGQNPQVVLFVRMYLKYAFPHDGQIADMAQTAAVESV